MGQGIADVVHGRAFAIKVENWSKKLMTLAKVMKVAQCSVLQTTTLNPLKYLVNAVQREKDQELEE